MIEVQLTAHDATGRVIAFTLGVATHLDRAKVAAAAGMRARLDADGTLAAKARHFTVEVL